MIKENNDPNRQILPYWPGRGHARGTLHITATSYASSNLPPDPHDADYTCEVRYQIPAVAGAPSARPPASLVEHLRHIVVVEPALVRQRLRSLAWRRPREAALTAVGYGLNQLARRSGPGFRALRFETLLNLPERMTPPASEGTIRR